MKIQTAKPRLLSGLLLVMVALFTIQPLLADNPPSDKDLRMAIETELLVQRGVYSHLIDVEANDGIVTLTGSVNNILEKERSAEVAKAVKGTRAVVNEIKVNAPDVDDFTLQKNIEDAWLKDPATDSYEITAKANDGVVTLNGTVESWQEKQLAAKVAKGVKGVRKVQNNIEVKYEPRPDFEIQKDIEQALKWDIYVDEGFVDVDVKNGKVKLKGTVGSASEKDFAQYDAWVSGVEAVNVDKLKVEPWAEDMNRRDQKFTIKPDEDVKQAVKDAFLYDPRVFSFNPEVDVRNGIVTLTGSVDNLKAKRAAEKDAKNVVGVLRVRNFLKVRPTETFSDAAITKNVQWALTKDPYVEKFEVNVKTTNGVVYLSGVVDSYFEKIQAEDAASTAKGVIAVINNLDISQVPQALNPTYNTPYYLYPWNVKADWEIKEDIESQLWWSPFVDANEVNVGVHNGHVELTGTVDSWRERMEAEENAFEGGALSVNNQLKIENNPYY